MAPGGGSTGSCACILYMRNASQACASDYSQHTTAVPLSQHSLSVFVLRRLERVYAREVQASVDDADLSAQRPVRTCAAAQAVHRLAHLHAPVAAAPLTVAARLAVPPPTQRRARAVGASSGAQAAPAVLAHLHPARWVVPAVAAARHRAQLPARLPRWGAQQLLRLHETAAALWARLLRLVGLALRECQAPRCSEVAR